MVNVTALKSGKFPGVITDIKEMPLKEFLSTPEKIKAFRDGMKKDNYPNYLKREGTKPEEIEAYKQARLDAKVIVIYADITVNGETRKLEKWVNIPGTGYAKSNLKMIHDIHKLPDDTEEWRGKPIEAYPDDDGYLQLIPP